MSKQPTRKASKTSKAGKPPKPRPRQHYSPEAEMADILYRAAQQPQPERIQDVLARMRSTTTAPVKVRIKTKSGAGGRPPSFKSKQIGELQKEQRDYEKDHSNAPKKDVEQHLQNWAKRKGITTSLGTIRKYMAPTKNKN
jgi:hypothetical protein